MINHKSLPQLKGFKCTLKPLTSSSVSAEYVSWLNDLDTNQYLESRFITHNIESASNFILNQINTGYVLFYGIWSLNNEHIGNIKLGPIDLNHLSADLGFLIGNKNFRGHGIASEAIRLISNYAFSQGLKKITAGAYEDNIGSIKALLKSNFHQEGLKISQVVSSGHRMNVLIFGLTN